ncbi:MAG: hypothetical protein ACKOWG_18090 [Planctomycetia bacterium]
MIQPSTSRPGVAAPPTSNLRIRSLEPLVPPHAARRHAPTVRFPAGTMVI